MIRPINVLSNSLSATMDQFIGQRRGLRTRANLGKWNLS